MLKKLMEQYFIIIIWINRFITYDWFPIYLWKPGKSRFTLIILFEILEDIVVHVIYVICFEFAFLCIKCTHKLKVATGF